MSAPRGSAASPASLAMAVLGDTPAAMITSSASMVRLSVTTRATAPSSPSSRTTFSPVSTVTPFFSRSWRTMRVRVEDRNPGMSRSVSSTTVTPMPHMSARATAISRPMNPPPTITALLTVPAATELRMNSASSRLVAAVTPARSSPSTGGRLARLPSASTSLS